MADYTAAIELPNAPAEQVAQALYNRGVRKGERGDSDGAIADYTAAIELPNAPAEVIEAVQRATRQLIVHRYKVKIPKS
jgi:hypothetical protein